MWAGRKITTSFTKNLLCGDEVFPWIAAKYIWCRWHRCEINNLMRGEKKQTRFSPTLLCSVGNWWVTIAVDDLCGSGCRGGWHWPLQLMIVQEDNEGSGQVYLYALHSWSFTVLLEVPLSINLTTTVDRIVISRTSKLRQRRKLIKTSRSSNFPSFLKGPPAARTSGLCVGR